MRSKIAKGFFSIFLAGVAFLGSCAGDQGQIGDTTTNKADIALSFPDGYSHDSSTHALYPPLGQNMASLPPYVTGITLSISGDDMETVVYPVDLATLSVSFSITPGLRTFTVVINTDRGISFTDSITLEVVSGATINLEFNLVVNISPSIGSISATPTKAKPGEIIALSCYASDPDPDDKLAYKWSGPGGWSAEGQQASYTIPNYGVFTFTCSVSDGRGGSASASVSVDAPKPAPPPPPPPPVNSPPVISLTNNLVTVCTYDFVCSATDADGDRLAFTMSFTPNASCTITGSGVNSINISCFGCAPESMKCSVSDGVNAPVAVTFNFP